MKARLFVSTVAALVAFAVLPSLSLAVPASPDIVEVEQPGGERFKARIMGDEFQGWVETEDGYSVARVKDTGVWEFAVKGKDGRLTPSGKRVVQGVPAPAGIKRHLKPSRDNAREKSFSEIFLDRTAQAAPSQGSGGVGPQAQSAPQAGPGDWDPVPVLGMRNLLIILVNFNDRTLNTNAFGWDTTTMSTAPGEKSVANFYMDNSFNALTIMPVMHTQTENPAGIVTVTIASNHPNYGGSFDYATETAWLTEALAQAANYVDFASLDTNQDGYFDDWELVVYFIPAGYEASGSGNIPNIWAHAWGGYPGIPAGSVNLTSWAMNGELNNSGVQHPMGVIAHELGHSMCGLPDLYDIMNMNEGLGAFSIMAAGSWGRAASDLYSGTTPVSLDAWSRQYTGWTNPRPSSGGLVSFGPALATPDAPVKLANTGVSASEYFLVENRYSEGWDQGLERWLGVNWGGGLLVQHIDASIGTPGLNDINQYVPGNHQGVMAEEASTASGSLVAGTSAGHVTHLFYDGNNASFTDTTTPDSRLYDGTSTNIEIFNISARAYTMTANLSILPSSVITSPSNGSSFTAANYTITGNATDNSGAGLDKVEVSTDGGATWLLATGTTNWSYNWKVTRPGSYTVISRATDLGAGVESPGYTISVSVNAFGTPELAHYDWDASFSGKGCALCHSTPSAFLPADFKDLPGFCYTCHNPAAVAHRSWLSGGGHGVMASITSAGLKAPAYGNVTSGEYDNRPFANLVDGDKVACVTCHNTMRKTEDFGRAWEMTTTSDWLTYTLTNGGWSGYGHLTPAVYRDTSLWSGPSYVKQKDAYKVDPLEYTYNETAGTVTFNTLQAPSAYIYVELVYPYLRVSSKDDNLCTDCHYESTHMGANCLTCHQAHNSSNLAGIRELVRTTDRSMRTVKFSAATGPGSCADADATYDGICEVCHTATLYHRRDGSGSSHNGGTDCASCHTHASGFAR